MRPLINRVFSACRPPKMLPVNASQVPVAAFVRRLMIRSRRPPVCEHTDQPISPHMLGAPEGNLSISLGFRMKWPDDALINVLFQNAQNEDHVSSRFSLWPTIHWNAALEPLIVASAQRPSYRLAVTSIDGAFVGKPELLNWIVKGLSGFQARVMKIAIP